MQITDSNMISKNTHDDARATRRRRSDKILTLGLLLASALAAGAETSSDARESPARIADAASGAVIAARRLDPERTLVEAQAPDARLRLARCDQPLKASRLAARPGARRETVRVACEGGTRWKVYVPVTVSSFETVVTLVRNLPRGHVITPDDLGTRKADTGALPSGYLLDTRAAVGHVLTQSATAGSVLRPNQLKADNAVRRGQAVALLSGNGPVTIRMGGVALGNAPVGGRVRAKNASSGTIVEGIVLNEAEIRVTGRH